MGVLVPMLTALFRYDCNRDIRQAFQLNPLVSLHSAFLDSFSFCRFQWRFIIFATSGYKLPLVMIGTVKHTVSRRAINNLIWYCKYLERRSHYIILLGTNIFSG